MAKYQNLINSISSVIRTNGNNEITGQILQDVLKSIVNVVGANPTYGGVAHPSDNPGTPDGGVVYIASEEGTYVNFGGLTLADNELAVLVWNGTSWSKESVTYIEDFEDIEQAKQEALDAIAEAIQGLNIYYDIETDMGAVKDVQLKDGQGNSLMPKTSNQPFVDLEKKVVNLLGNYTPFIASSNASLVIVSDVNYRLSDPIPVREGDVLNFRFGDNPSVSKFSVILNENMEYVTHMTAKESDRTLTCPANSAWLVMSYGRLRNGEDNKTPLLINGVEWEGIEHVDGISKIEDRIGYNCVEFKYTGSHSSNSDRVKVNIKQGEQFVVRYNNSAGVTSQLYAVYSGAVSSSLIQAAKPSGEYSFVANNDIDYIGLFGNTVEEEATVRLEVFYGGLGMETFGLKPLAEDLQNLLNDKEKAQIYVSGGYTKIEENKGSGKSIYIRFANSLCVRIIASLNLNTMSQIAEHLGVELVTSPSGVENCIEIPNTNNLVFDTQTSKFAIKSRTNITRFDIVLIMCVDGTCKYIANGLQATYVEELSSIKTDIKSLQDSGAVVIGDIPTEANQFSALFKSAVGEVESFLLFSDPHFYSDYEQPIIKPSAVPYISKYKKYFDSTPTSFVLCCGDWLTKHRQTVAVQDLGQIDGQMNAMFPNCYYPVFGNHDDNYQGSKDDSDIGSWDGQLNKQIVANLMFRKFGKAYYSFIGASSRFYVFDSCLDSNTSMDNYKWTQVDWFGKSLAENDDEHIILVTHIAELNYSDGPSGFGGNILPLIENVTLIAQAFNGRNSITLNGITYNFQSANGKVSLLICGHTHYDAMAVHNDIPMYNITTSQSDGRFDLILIDYTEKKLKSVRVGGGENRELAIL